MPAWQWFTSLAGEQVWTKEALNHSRDASLTMRIRRDDSFETKYQRQLADQHETVVKLAAELVLIYFLFPSSVTGTRKRDLIQKVSSWKQIEIPPAGLAAMQCLDDGIGGPGQAYNMRRPFESGFLLKAPDGSFPCRSRSAARCSQITKNSGAVRGS